MDSIQNTVYYCCVSKGNRVLYAHSGGDHEIENLAALCLERTPPFHTWCFQTVRKKTFGFLMEDGYVYFTIVDEGLGNPGVLQFLEHVRDEFKKVAKKGTKGSFSGLNSVCIEEQLVPVIRRLISSLEHVSQSNGGWMAEIGPSPSPEGQTDATSSTKAPLLGKPSKQEKKKMKDHVVEIRENELEEQRKSSDRDIRNDLATLEPNNQGMEVSAISLQKGSSSMRIRSGPQYIRKMWCRKVRIVLAIDACVCVLLLVIWLFICHGFECIH